MPGLDRHTPPPLVLGSSSRYRAELLARLGVPFEQRSPEVDERAFDGEFDPEAPEELALTLARAKAKALSEADPSDKRWRLCADQVGVLHGADGPGTRRLLSKPGTAERCVEQLMAMSGKTHELVNGVVLVSGASSFEAVDIQRMKMRAFDRAEAQRYVDAFAPVDSAGGYRIEDAGILLFERIQSDDFTGIIGLPLLATARLFRQAGLL